MVHGSESCGDGGAFAHDDEFATAGGHDATKAHSCFCCARLEAVEMAFEVAPSLLHSKDAGAEFVAIYFCTFYACFIFEEKESDVFFFEKTCGLG